VFEYRTEIVVPPDRYVCLQLPANLPPGRATVTVLLIDVPASEGESGTAAGSDLELDRQDIEWWDEFEEDRERVG
jgi:hypothetical protein